MSQDDLSAASTPRFRGDWEQNLLMWCDSVGFLECVKLAHHNNNQYFIWIHTTKSMVYIYLKYAQPNTLHVHFFDHLHPSLNTREVVDVHSIEYLKTHIISFARLVLLDYFS